jgi:hypothetical protein
MQHHKVMEEMMRSTIEPPPSLRIGSTAYLIPRMNGRPQNASSVTLGLLRTEFGRLEQTIAERVSSGQKLRRWGVSANPAPPQNG